MKLLLDTNALIDHVAQRQPYCKAIDELCVASYFGDIELWVPVQSFLDALYSLRKMTDQRTLRNAFIGCLEFFHPCGSRANDLLAALKSNWPDVEDYLIACSAIHVDADYLVTRDTAGFVSSKTKTITPDEAIKMLRKKGFTYEEVEL